MTSYVIHFIIKYKTFDFSTFKKLTFFVFKHDFQGDFIASLGITETGYRFLEIHNTEVFDL